MQLFSWAKKYNVPVSALLELREIFKLNTQLEKIDDGSEAAVSAAVQFEATQKGLRLWRNNVGGTYDGKGRFIRYGLCNETAEMNKTIKSSDFIGIRPILIGPEMVGNLIGQFVAREIKESGWAYAGTDRERAQLKFLELVAAFGGDASFANGQGTL